MALNKKKILFITMGVITLAVFAGTFAFLFNINIIKPQIEAAASTALELDVRIKGRMGIDLFPEFGLSLNDVIVRSRGVDIVTSDKMIIGLKLFPLLRKRFQITRIGFIGPVFSLVRYKNGMFNFGDPGANPSENPRAEKKISIFQGNLVYADETSGKRIEAKNVDLIVENFSYNGVDGTEPAKSISFTGNIECETLKIYDFTLTDIVMRATGEKGKIDIDLVSMMIFGGTGNGSIGVDVSGPLPHYRVDYTLNQFRIEALLQQYALQDLPPKTIEGPVNFSVDLTATGKSADEVKRSLTGGLTLNGEGLMLNNIDIDALVRKYEQSQNFNLVDVGAVLIAGPFGPLLTKSYNFASLYQESWGGTGTVRKLVSVWKVHDGIAEAQDVALASKKQRVAMKGGLDFINERFVNVTVAATDQRGCIVYGEKVNGPFRNPRIDKENIFTSIAGPILNPVVDAWKFIQGKKCEVFYSGSVAHPQE